MGKSQREKGKAGEREVAHLFRQAGYWAERTRQSRGDHDPDVRVRCREGGFETPVHVEVKRIARIAALRFMEQAEEDVGESSSVPIVFMREDGRKKWTAMLDAEVFLGLLAEHPLYRPNY